ncbi:MAG TPA: Zn-dependent alcohol dehydrogenase [Ktedonosporobacter sp.]|jgi:S-(hydroxymethyl)glutathione dehydrogenase/alcohol dehydrogenase|nr:Zn-dependent alcohol dehydrogenase [Ktedonosporobacter sp.]
MKTRTAVIYAPGEPIRIEEIEVDPPKEHEVQVRMVAAGICHSDYHIITGELPSYLPLALGHEGAGIVEAVGPNVTNCKVGDHVVLSFVPSCGTCYYCTKGHTNLCNMGASILMGPQLDGTFRMHTQNGTDVGQMCVISTFSERTVVSDMSVVPIPDYYPLNRAVLVGCGVPTGVGAVIHRAKIEVGSTVMVIGCGGIGMNAVQGAAIAGARMIIAVDVNDFKLEKAKEFGATHTINSTREDVVQVSKDLTWGVGVDYAFEAIATPATIGQAYACIGKNGTVCVIGLTPATAESIPIPPLDLVLFQKTVMGTLYGDSQPRTDIPNLLQMYGAGKLKLDELVTRTYTLDQVNEAYADMVAGKNIRGVIEF